MLKDYLLGATIFIGLGVSMYWSLSIINPLPLLAWFAVSIILISNAAMN